MSAAANQRGAAGAPLLVDEELADRVHRAACAFSVGWVAGAAALPENPLGLRLRRFGAVWATARPGLAELDFMNTVYGLRPEDAGELPAIAAFYEELGLRPWLELVPAPGFERLAGALHALGFGQIGFHAALVGRPGPPAPAGAGIEVEEVAPERMDAFAGVLLAGHGLPADARARERPAIEQWPAMGGVRLYLACVDGAPAAAAALRVCDGVGLLANASTLPGQRGRGCQTALIQRRITDAAESGCELVAALAGFASPSQRNLERAGLGIAYTMAVWRRYPASSPSRASAG